MRAKASGFVARGVETGLGSLGFWLVALFWGVVCKLDSVGVFVCLHVGIT